SDAAITLIGLLSIDRRADNQHEITLRYGPFHEDGILHAHAQVPLVEDYVHSSLGVQARREREHPILVLLGLPRVGHESYGPVRIFELHQLLSSGWLLRGHRLLRV